MPSTPYDLVQDDQDLRIPLHAEQAFLNGITFQAKYIGSEEVSRPNTRAEIVQAMRRIRYDYKVRNEKKKKVTITVSVDGVKVLLKKRRRKKKQWISEPEEFLYHPIYRIFYVSHDSSDLKIFSYIARDSSTDKFKCAVFKSNKKSQAMRIVRTVGQAFEVCHKFNLHKNSLDNNEERSDASSDLLDVEHTSEQLSDEDLSKKEQTSVTPDISPPLRPNHLELTPQLNSNNRKSPCVLTDEDKSPSSPISPSREINKLKDQLEQQAMQTRQALAQLMLVREQLISETNARIEAQARTQQLLQQNRELLEHLASLGAYTDPQATTGLTSANIALAPQSQLQMLFQEPADLSAAMRKAILASTNNNNLATINQQISNLGSINQQLTTLSHQLSGLNQQSQNLQNFQNLSATLQQQQQHQQQQQQQQHQSLTPPQQQQLHQSSLHLNTPPVSQPSSSPIPPMAQLQTLSNQFTNISAQGNQDLLSKELFQMNQELLNRLQALNLGAGNSGNNPGNLNGAGALGNNNSPHNSFFYVNPMSCSPNNNNSFNFLSSPSSLGNLTPSPMGTLNRNSYSNSPINDDLGLSIDKNLNSLEENQHFMKPLSSMGAASNGNLAGASGSGNSGLDNSRSSAEASTSSSPNRTNEQRFNTVMLKLSSTAKVARWFQQLPWHTASLSRPESGFVSGDSRSEKYHEDHNSAKEPEDDLCDEFLLVEGSSSIWTKMSAKKRRKLLGMRLGKVTTF